MSAGPSGSENLTSLRSEDPAVANSVSRARAMSGRSFLTSTWEFADGGWLVAWYSDFAGGVH